MGSGPTIAAANMYCQYRMRASKSNPALKSREGAAEELGISPYSLANHELGNTKCVPVETIAAMVAVYNAPELRNYYCSSECPLGRSRVPTLNFVSLEYLALQYIKAYREGAAIEDYLLDITVGDGTLEEKKKMTAQLLNQLDSLLEIIQTFRMWAEKQG